MNEEEAGWYFHSTASATVPTRFYISKPDIDVVLPVSKKGKRGKYWESPKYKFTGKR